MILLGIPVASIFPKAIQEVNIVLQYGFSMKH